MVLIETLWNVKKLPVQYEVSCLNRINRNIVECKVRRWHLSALPEFRINRNIVECKAIAQLDVSVCLMFSINRNIVECKG